MAAGSGRHFLFLCLRGGVATFSRLRPILQLSDCSLVSVEYTSQTKPEGKRLKAIEPLVVEDKLGAIYKAF